MICAKCDYVMTAFDAECPRCHGKGIDGPTQSTSSAHKTQALPTEAEQGQRPSQLQKVKSNGGHDQPKPIFSALVYVAVLFVVLPIIGFAVDSVRNQIPNRQAIHTFFAFASFASFICLIVGLISPKTFSSRPLGIDTTRKNIGYIFGTAVLLFAVIFGSTMSDEQKVRMAADSARREQMRIVEEQASSRQRVVEEGQQAVAEAAECKSGPNIKNSAWDSSVAEVKTYLNNNLKDRRSIEYIEWSPVAKHPSLPQYVVRCKFRAKNSLGAYVLANKVFRLNCDGEVISVEDN